MPIVKKGELPVILFGETLKNTGMDEMYHFLKSCKNRVYPDIEEVA